MVGIPSGGLVLLLRDIMNPSLEGWAPKSYRFIKINSKYGLKILINANKLYIFLLSKDGGSELYLRRSIILMR